MLRNETASWGALAKGLHWTIALLVFVQIALGFLAVGWRLSPAKLDLYVWHKSTGMLILALMVARVAWRLADPAPAAPAGLPPLHRRAAWAIHFLLYVALVMMPVTGWVVASASNVPFRIFWLMPLPAIVPPDKAVQAIASRVHLALFVVLAVLLAAHIAAALRHHFVLHDGVLARMLPRRTAPS